MLDFDISLTSLQTIIAELRDLPRANRLALRRAINRTIVTARTNISKEIRTGAGLRAGTIRARLKIIRATNSTLRGIIEIISTRIPLIEFRARQTKRGVTYSIVSGSRVLLEQAFIATTQRGKQVLKRARDPRTPGKLVGRDPVFIRFGPPLTALFQQLLPNFQQDVTQVLVLNYDRELAFELSRVR